MKSRVIWIMTFMIVASMLLSACGGAEAAEVPPPPQSPKATEVPPEPTAEPEPTEVPLVPAGDDQIDEAYNSVLGSMAKYNTIGLESFAEQLAGDPAPFVLDVRQPEEPAEKGHIEGAVLIPLRELGANLDKLPSFDTPIVSYCGSGWRCTIAMTGLGALGWENVLSLKGNSFGGWVEAGYPVVEGIPADAAVLDAADPDPAMVLTMEEMFATIPEGWGGVTSEQLATELAENPDLVVIDVRRTEEVEEKGAIPGSLHIPLENFVNQRSAWPEDLDAPIVIYCGSGHRSTVAMTIMWTYGYSDVRSLKGGFTAWTEAGYPVEGGHVADPEALLDEAYADFLAEMVKYNTIGLEDLNLALGEEPPPYLLDVREVAEAEEKGHIENAYLIPLREVGQNYDLLPSFETPTVSYCSGGWRCTIAMTALGALGWEEIKALKGNSYTGWVDGGYPTVEGVPPDAEPLNAAVPDQVLADHMADVLANVPEGFGVLTVENLAVELAENPELILVDVRTPGERVEKGIIDNQNQLALPLEDFISQKSNWPADKDATIVAYCGSGHRSTMAMTILWSYGFNNVRSMKGGFNAWSEAALPVTEAEAMN